MSNENIDVRYIANLARIDVTDEECTTFQSQLEAVLGYVESLKDANIEEIELTDETQVFTEVLREDISRNGLQQADLIRNAPDSALGQVRVPQVVDA
ncbi:MAG: Asp-tRNA(Asn)/Glu-tRNA(Gln) amidotransferase subunit GatC [Akkermansiaceae bacterium]